MTCNLWGRLDAGWESVGKKDGVLGPEAEAENEKVGSSSGSHDGSGTLEESRSDSLCSSGGGREETLLFFEDDVLKVSCPCSSEWSGKFVGKEGRAELGQEDVYCIGSNRTKQSKPN